MARWSYIAYGALVGLGAANREMTALLLLLAFVGLRPKEWRVALVYAGIAASVYVGIRLAVGPKEPITAAGVFTMNFEPWVSQLTILYMALLFPLVIHILLSWPRADRQLKRLFLLIAVFYIPLWAALAIWHETRLLMPLLILTLPMITRHQPVSQETALAGTSTRARWETAGQTAAPQ